MSDFYDLVNLGVCIKMQAERLGVEHADVPLEGVVVRIAAIGSNTLEWAERLGDADARTDQALGYIDRTLDNGESGTHHWRNDEVMEMLRDVRRMLDPQPSDPSAKRVDTSPEHANETPESWHVDQPSDLHTDGSGA